MNLLVATPALAAELPGTITVTSPTNAKLAAGTGKQVVLLTVGGTGATPLSEATVTGVKLGNDAPCANIQSYVVTSATTLTVKTPTGGCAASSGGTAETIQILFGADYIQKTSAITFVNPPSIAAVGTDPVFTDNSLNLPSAEKVKRFHTTGGQIVRVQAAGDFAFDPRSTAGLAVSLGGKAGSEIKVYDSTAPTTPLATTAAGTVGNALTFKTPAGMSTADPNLVITQNGVNKTFTTADTGIAGISAKPTITSISPEAGRAGTAQAITITGTNFDKDAAKYTGGTIDVTICGVEATTFGTPPVNTTGTQISVTVPAALVNADPGLGTGAYAGPCPVQITDGTAAGTSPLNAASIYTMAKE